MAANSNGHQRRLLIRLHSRTTEFPPTSGRQRPCRDAGVGAIALGLAMLKRAKRASHLIHQRHLTSSCGGHAPTAERTLHPARMLTESLTPQPELENDQDPSETWATADFRSAKAFVCPSPKRDIIPYCMNTTPARGVKWQSTSGGEISLSRLVARRPGRLRRTRSSRASCRPLDSWAQIRLQRRANGPPPLFSDCANSVGL